MLMTITGRAVVWCSCSAHSPESPCFSLIQCMSRAGMKSRKKNSNLSSLEQFTCVMSFKAKEARTEVKQPRAKASAIQI